MTRDSSLSSICASALAAGPVFVTSSALAAVYLRLPQPVIIEAADMLAFLILLLSALAVGFVPALMINFLGCSFMMAFEARQPQVWAAAGAAGGAFIALIFTEDAATLFALTVTGAVCALICRNGIDAD